MGRSNDGDVLGYIILENESLDMPVKNIQVIDKPHLFYIRFDACLQSLDVVNRNNRKYKSSAMLEGLRDPNLDELMRNKKWKGECDHPVTTDIQRIAVVLSKYASHYILKWWNKDNLICGTLETIDDGRYGTGLARRILQGENPSFSLRALAALVQQGNIKCVNQAPRIIAYDEVNLPSHKEAYAFDNKEKIISDGKNETVLENASISDKYVNSRYKNISKQGGVIPLTKNDLKDTISKNCENLKIVCESFDIDPATFNLTNNPNTVTVKNGSDTFAVKVGNAKLCREINDYYSYLRR